MVETRLTLRLDWSEMDFLFGHINNVQYFKYVQAARVHFWDEIGLHQLYESSKIGAILAKTSCDFVFPLHFPGEINIVSKTDFIGNTSFGIHHEIFNDSGVLCAVSKDVVVLYDYNILEKVQVNRIALRL